MRGDGGRGEDWEGEVMSVGERAEGVEVEVRGRINGGEELHCCGFEAQSGRSGAIIEGEVEAATATRIQRENYSKVKMNQNP